MLEVLLLAFAGLALWHFIIDGIVAADARVVVRAEVSNTGFALDRLRARRPELNGPGCEVVRASLVSLVRHPAAFSLWAFCSAKHDLSHDGELQRRAAERSQTLAAISDSELSALRDRLPTLAMAYLTINSMGWAIYVVPVAMAVAMYKKTMQTLAWVLSMPEQELSKIDPQGPCTRSAVL